MNKIQLEILMLTESLTFNNTYSLVLGEKNANRRFSFVIRKTDAQAIALSLDGLNPKRPLTQDLMHKSFQVFNIDILEVVITQLKEGTFYSIIVCKKGDIIVELDSRTSDAIALALRFNSPIFVNEKILDEVGVEVKEIEKQTIEQFQDELEDEMKEFADEIVVKNELEQYSKQELEEMISKALEEENYEYAANLRDELNRR